MAVIALPYRGIRSIEWTLPKPAAFLVESGWTGDQTVGDLGGTLDGWRATIELTIKFEPDLAEWRGFFARLRGPVNTFLLGVTERAQRTRPAWTVAVDGGGQIGDTIAVRDAPHNLWRLVQTGDVVSIRNRGYTVLAIAPTNGAGKATLSLSPPIERPLADGDAVRIGEPLIEMRRAGGRAGWTVSPGTLYQPFSFEAVAVRP